MTEEELKADENVESYNQFTSGWVKEVKKKKSIFKVPVEITLVIGWVST